MRSFSLSGLDHVRSTTDMSFPPRRFDSLLDMRLLPPRAFDRGKVNVALSPANSSGSDSSSPAPDRPSYANVVSGVPTSIPGASCSTTPSPIFLNTRAQRNARRVCHTPKSHIPVPVAPSVKDNIASLLRKAKAKAKPSAAIEQLFRKPSSASPVSPPSPCSRASPSASPLRSPAGSSGFSSGLQVSSCPARTEQISTVGEHPLEPLIDFEIFSSAPGFTSTPNPSSTISLDVGNISPLQSGLLSEADSSTPTSVSPVGNGIQLNISPSSPHSSGSSFESGRFRGSQAPASDENVSLPPSASNLSCTCPTELTRSGNKLSILFPFTSLSCPEVGCSKTYTNPDWTIMKGSLIKHLKNDHGLGFLYVER